MAAVLACGAGAVVSHRTAAVVWGMLSGEGGHVELTLPSGNGRRSRAGIVVHRSAGLTAGQVTRRRRIPVTKPARTLRDLHRTAPERLYLRAVRRALDLRLISSADLREEEVLTRSELERRFLALCRRHRLPAPEVNAKVGRYEADFLWRDRRVIAETDSFRHHSHRAAFESDRARDAELQAAGYRLLHFTHRQVVRAPAEVARVLRTVLSREAAGGSGDLAA
jgi:very-short-patch-repair endonuclease